MTCHMTCGHGGTEKTDGVMLEFDVPLRSWPSDQAAVQLAVRPPHQADKWTKCWWKDISGGKTLHLGLGKLFSCFSTTRPLFFSGPFFITRGYNTLWKRKHFLPARLKTSLWFLFSPPPVGRTLFNSPLIMFLFCGQVHNNSSMGEIGGDCW